MKLKEFKQRLLKDPEFKKEYETYDLAFEVSQMLTEARIIKGVTQEKLAKMISTTQSSIARAESGNYLPRLSFLKKISDGFRTNLIVRFGFMEAEELKFSNKSPSSNQATIQGMIGSPRGYFTKKPSFYTESKMVDFNSPGGFYG